MGSPDDLPFTSSAELPPYRGIVAVDAKGFTDQPGRLHQPISGLIPQLAGQAFADIGLAEAWNEPAFFGPTGDGFAVGVPTRVMPFLVHPFLSRLQDVLAHHNSQIRAAEPQIRLRVSLNIGPVEEDENPYLGGNGTARNDTHRLLDSVPVKAILAAASPRVTFVAAIVSERLFRDVIEQGYAGVHPDHFIEVPATVEGKSFEQRAWLYVPRPSGNLLAAGVTGPAPAPSSPPSSADKRRPATSTTINAPGNQGGIAGTVHGNMTWGDRRPS
jgi:hypothetical protein